jgi:arginine N-succinyltransferase
MINLIRPAAMTDLDGLAVLAKHLDTINLPADRHRLSHMLGHSAEQLAGDDTADRAIIFVLEDGDGTLCGSANIIARHGSPQAPHCFFDVIDEERYSPRLNKVFHHKVLRLGTSFVPRTEIGGLVLDPTLRGKGLGRFLSLTRFQFIAAYRSRFCDHVLAELLPPLDEEGNSPLWNALGHRFTGLTYREADRLSGQEKEFIEDLFPRSDLHVSLFSPQTQSVIEKVGQATEGALSLLRDQGFFYTKRIDPFDGGPHYRCQTDDIRCVKNTRSIRGRAGSGSVDAIVGLQVDNAADYRALRCNIEIHGMEAEVPKEALERLGAGQASDLLISPL